MKRLWGLDWSRVCPEELPVLDPRTALIETGLFAVLDDDAISRLAHQALVENHLSGTRILTEGERGDSVLIVLDGSVEVYHEHEGQQLVVATLGPGAHLGELALLLGGGRRTASVRAYVDVTLLRVPPEILAAVVAEDSATRARLKAAGEVQLARSLAQRSLLVRVAIDSGLPIEVHSIQAGAVLFQEGDQAFNAYLVLDGTAAVYVRSDDGPVLVRRLVEGQLVGERGVRSKSYRSATVVAETDLKLLIISRKELKRLATESDLWKHFLEALERVYSSPKRGFMTQHSGRVKGVPSIVTTYSLDGGRLLVATRLLGKQRILLESPGMPIERRIEWGPTLLELDAHSVLRGADARGMRSTLSRLVGLILDEVVLTDTDCRRFERDGVLPAIGRELPPVD
ncbi:MAG: cyclic nucleotide-binding domain-containing protein [Myxococcota bacterium]